MKDIVSNEEGYLFMMMSLYLPCPDSFAITKADSSKISKIALIHVVASAVQFI